MNKKTLIFIVTTVVVLSLITVGFIYFYSEHLEKELENHKSLQADINIKNQPYVGDKDAPVTLIEFFDIKCPPCKQWNETVFPKLNEKYIKKHKLKIVFINNPLPSHGKDAYFGALALETIYKQSSTSSIKIMKALYDKQQETSKNWVDEDLILSLTKNERNIDFKRFKKDLTNKSFQVNLEDDLKMAKKAQVNATPTIFINSTRVESIVQTENGKKIEPNPFDVKRIEQMIDKELLK